LPGRSPSSRRSSCLDEPCSGLDPISTAKIEEALSELKKEYTIVLVSNNTKQIARATDYAAFFYMSKLVEYGITSSIFHHAGGATDRRLHPREVRIMPDCALKTEELNLFYGSFQGLKDVDFCVYTHSITALIGPSGCGKSTLLRCFNRMNDLIDDVTIKGTVLVTDRRIGSLTSFHEKKGGHGVSAAQPLSRLSL